MMNECLRELNSTELAQLVDVVIHPAVTEEVRRRFVQRYEQMAYAYYNGDYHKVGNVTELGIEDHGLVSYREMACELVPYIRTLL